MVLFDEVVHLATLLVVILARKVVGSPLDATLSATLSVGADGFSLPELRLPPVDSELAKIPNRTSHNSPELISFLVTDGKHSIENQNAELGVRRKGRDPSAPEMLEFSTGDGKNSVQINQDYDISLNRTKLMTVSKTIPKSFPPTDEDFMEHDNEVFKFQPSNGSVFGNPKNWQFNVVGKLYELLNRNLEDEELEPAANNSSSLETEENPPSFVLLNTSQGFIEPENKTTVESSGIDQQGSKYNATAFKEPKRFETNFRPQFRPSQTINFITHDNRDGLKPFYTNVVNSYGEPAVPYGLALELPVPGLGIDKVHTDISALDDVPTQGEEVSSVKDTRNILKDLVEKLVRLDLNSTGSLAATHSLDIDGKLLHTSVALSYGRPYRHKITEVPAGTPLSGEDKHDYVGDEEYVKKGGGQGTTTTVAEENDEDYIQNDEGNNSQDSDYTTSAATTRPKTTTTPTPRPTTTTTTTTRRPRPTTTTTTTPRPRPTTTTTTTPRPRPTTTSPTTTPRPRPTTTSPTTTPRPLSRPKSKPKPQQQHEEEQEPQPSTKPKRQNNKMAVKPMKSSSVGLNKKESKNNAAKKKTKPSEVADPESDADTSQPEEVYPIVEPIRIKKGTTTTTPRPAASDEGNESGEGDDNNSGGIVQEKPVAPSSESTSNEDENKATTPSSDDDNYHENKLVHTKNKRPSNRPDQEAAFSNRKPVTKPTKEVVVVDSSEEVDYYENVPSRLPVTPVEAGSYEVKRPEPNKSSTNLDEENSDEGDTSGQKQRPDSRGSDEETYQPVKRKPETDFSGSNEDPDVYKPVTSKKPEPDVSDVSEEQELDKPVTSKKPEPDSSDENEDQDFYKPVTSKKPEPDSSDVSEEQELDKPVTSKKPEPDVSDDSDDQELDKPVISKKPTPDVSDENEDQDFYKPVISKKPESDVSESASKPVTRPPPTRATPYTRLPLYSTNKAPRLGDRNSEQSTSDQSTSDQSTSSSEETKIKQGVTTAGLNVNTTTAMPITIRIKESGSGESGGSREESGSQEYYSGEDDYYYSHEYSGSYDDRDFSYSGSVESGSNEFRRSKSHVVNGTEVAVGGEEVVKRPTRKFRKGRKGTRMRRRQGRKLEVGRRMKPRQSGKGRRVQGVKRSHRLVQSRSATLNGSLDELARIGLLKV